MRITLELPDRWVHWLQQQQKLPSVLIINALNNQYGDIDESLEQRQIVGKVIYANQITPDHQLALVNGIYYHFVIVDNHDHTVFLPQQSYQVVGNVGNVLQLKIIK